MNVTAPDPHPPLADRMAQNAYWPALAAIRLRERKYSAVVELCKEHLSETPGLISGRLFYATALFKAGQTESASEQFYRVLADDPNNIVALKYLGDIAFKSGDEFTAYAYSHRILEIDPLCSGINSDLAPRSTESTRTVTLVHGSESVSPQPSELRAIPFYTETMGDLYLKQGHARLAAAVYRSLHQQTLRPHLLEKLKQAEDKARDKEKRISEHVTITD